MKNVNLCNVDGEVVMTACVLNNGNISMHTIEINDMVTPEAFAEFNRKIRLESKHRRRILEMAKRIK